jgi:hypothetical protein
MAGSSQEPSIMDVKQHQEMFDTTGVRWLDPLIEIKIQNLTTEQADKAEAKMNDYGFIGYRVGDVLTLLEGGMEINGKLYSLDSIQIDLGTVLRAAKS